MSYHGRGGDASQAPYSKLPVPTACLCWEVVSRMWASAQVSETQDSTVEKLVDKYVVGEAIGEGAFGVVRTCQKKGTCEERAVKMVDREDMPLEEIALEADMLRKLEHPRIVKLHDVYYEKHFVSMVLDLYAGDLIDGMQLHWKNKGRLAIPVVQSICKMMVESVAWLHQNNVAHRDLKGENFLMDCRAIEHPNCRVFLSDFGTAVEVLPGHRLSHKCGTQNHWAPELYDLNYGLAVDVWAIGVIAFGMVTGMFPFKNEDECRARPVRCPARTTRDGESFILGTLVRNEAERLTAAQALEHRFLSSRPSRWPKMTWTPKFRDASARMVQAASAKVVQALVLPAATASMWGVLPKHNGK